MSYGDFAAQIKGRGAESIEALTDEKLTRFVFEGEAWTCAGKNRARMVVELADGYEMRYCLPLYCLRLNPSDQP